VRVLAVGNMYPPHHLGGYELMWHSAVRHLRAHGHELRILTTDYRSAAPDPTIPEDPEVRRDLRWYWRDHRFPRLSASERLALERHNARVLERELGDFEPEVVSWWAMGGMSLSLIESVRRRGLPAVGIVIDDWMVYGPRVDAWLRSARRLGPLARLRERRTGIPTAVQLGTAGEWVFVSERTRAAALAAGRRLARSSIAHGGVDGRRFRPALAAPWRWRLLCLGRIDRRKGVETAIRALAELPQARLTVAGRGDEDHLRSLRGLAIELGVAGRVSFERPDRESVPATYAAADAVLFPVVWEEPWGLVPLEAMASGRPVIATGAGGSGEYLRDGENCLLFAPREDPAALAGAVRRLAGDGELRERLRGGGLATAASLTEERFNEAVRSAIERAAAKAAGVGR
jgi:glycogen synthase